MGALTVQVFEPGGGDGTDGTGVGAGAGAGVLLMTGMLKSKRTSLDSVTLLSVVV